MESGRTNEPSSARSARSLASMHSVASTTSSSSPSAYVSSSSNNNVDGGNGYGEGSSSSSSRRDRTGRKKKDWKDESLAKWVRLAQGGGIGRAVALKDNVAASKRWLMFLTGDIIVILLELVPGEVFLGFCEGVIGQFRGSDVEIQSLKAAAPRIIASGAYTAAAAASPARGSSADTPMGTTGAESSVHVRSLDSPKESLDFAATECLPSPTAAATSDADLLSPTPLRPPTRPPLGARATSSSSTTATLGVVSSLAGAPSSSRGHTVAGTMPSREPSPAVSDSDPFALDYEVDVDDDRRSSRSRPGSTATVARKSSVASTNAKALKAVNASEEASDFHPEALATPRPNVSDRPASPAHSLTESIDSYSESRGGSSAASHGGMDGRYDAEWDVFARYTRESVYHALAPQPQAASDATEPSPSTLRAIEPVATPEDEPASLASRLRLRIQNTGRGRGNASASDGHPGTTMALPTLSPEPISSPTASDRSDHLQTPHQPSSSAFEGDVVENAGAEGPDEQESPYDMSDSKRRWSYESSVNADAERSQVNLPDTPSHQRFAPPVSSPTPTWTPTLSPTMSSPRPNISNPPNPFGQAKPRGAFFPAPETDRPRSQSFSHFHFDRLEVPLPTESFVPEKLWLEDVSPPGRRNGSHTRQKSTASSLRSKMSRRGKTPEPQQQQPPDESPVPAERKPRRSLSIKSLRSKRETTPTTPTKLDIPPPMPKLTKQSSRVTPSESAVSSRDYFGTVSHDGTDFQVARAGETRHALPSDASHVEEDEWGFLGASPVPVVYRKHGRNVPKTEQAMLAIIAKRRTDGAAKKLGKMLAVDGAPPSIRFKVWCWLLGAPADRSAESQYHRLVDRYSAPKLEVFAIPPEFASHRAFQGDGVARLQEMIATLRYHKPKSYLGEGTCWLAMIVFMQAFDVSHAFALTDMVLDKFASQMSPDLIRTDAIVLESMVVEMDAKLALHLKACALNYEDLCRYWFTSLFASSLPYPTVLELLSLISADGYSFALRAGLAVISLQSKRIQQLRDGRHIAQCLMRPMADELVSPGNVLRACEAVALSDDKLTKRRSKVKR